MSELPQYAEPWIVFDRDKLTNFDKIIEEATSANINVAWSNPCIEIWFYSYFGEMPYYQSSVDCCKAFGAEFKKRLNQEYAKTDKRLYFKLSSNGDEKKAIDLAKTKLKASMDDKSKKPSDMNPATTVHLLIEEIISKV